MCGLINIERFVRPELLRRLPPGADVVANGEGGVLLQFASGALVPLTEFLQLDRANGDWLPPGRGPAGAYQTVTHWSTALDDLGSPEPKPYGPRGVTPTLNWRERWQTKA